MNLIKPKEQMEVFTIGPAGNRISTGQYADRGTQVGEGFYVVGVNNWIINKDGKVLVQKRSKHKKDNPGKWSSTNGLKVPGEESIDTVIRETYEELGIVLEPTNIKYLDSRVADKSLIVDIFISQADIDINQMKIQEEEVERFRFVTREELLDLDISTTCQYIKEIIDLLFSPVSEKNKN